MTTRAFWFPSIVSGETLFSFQLAKKQMGSIFGEENIENFSINIHMYLKSSSMS